MTKSDLPVNATLEQAKQVLRDGWVEGVECPCCTQFVKQYHRKITSSMAYGLVLIYRYFETHPEEQYVHISDYLNGLDLPGAIRNTGDITKLKYWGLIEEKPEMRDDGSKHAGYWSITELGRQFAKGETTVQSHAKIFNSKSYGLVGEPTTIQEALGEKFNYTELMKA